MEAIPWLAGEEFGSARTDGLIERSLPAVAGLG